jgi:hypothetical protein
MKILLVRLVAVLSLCLLMPPAVADVLTKGQTIEEVEKAMKKAGYGATELAVMPMTGEDLRFWAIDEDGTLIIHFDPSTRKVTKMRYWLTEDRPKAEREQFRLEVVAFDTESGVMTIQTKKKATGKAAPQKG